MRWLLLLSALIFANAWSSEPVKPTRGDGKRQTQPEYRGTEEVPLFVKGQITTEKDKEGAKNDADERKIKAETDAALVKYTRWLALFTFLLFCFTAALWWVTYQLSRDAKKTSDRQAKEVEKSLAVSEKAAAAAKESADAALKSSMPVIYPYITEMGRLHPLGESANPLTYDANIFIAFDNYGKTPGIIREVRAELFFTDKDEPPPNVNIDGLKSLPYPVWVPADQRGKDVITGWLDLKQSFTLTPIEYRELQAEADPAGKFRRFALIGRVIYDDLFANRHSSPFFLKLRLWRVGLAVHVFQVPQGGSKYVGVKTEKIPNPDPLDTVAQLIRESTGSPFR